MATPIQGCTGDAPPWGGENKNEDYEREI